MHSIRLMPRQFRSSLSHGVSSVRYDPPRLRDMQRAPEAAAAMARRPTYANGTANTSYDRIRQCVELSENGPVGIRIDTDFALHASPSALARFVSSAVSRSRHVSCLGNLATRFGNRVGSDPHRESPLCQTVFCLGCFAAVLVAEFRNRIDKPGKEGFLRATRLRMRI
jgi:hypothetical protein